MGPHQVEGSYEPALWLVAATADQDALSFVSSSGFASNCACEHC